ncbi:DUF937 domain-containing protein [Flavimarina sp. Hel_I_48]|uniref:DUF937 domain-containing protein n=1 Tax=Flavimarina sp. Hel_I_48 TaxID=1392488 RepID=UPI0004DFC619|nr:DUF937 domain-containing protein [Flavimarina sp. Hel_I_48]
MSGLLDLLNNDTAKQLISSTSKETGASEDKTSSVLQMALPLLLGAMNKNAATPQGASSLLGALSNKHDGSILDNLGSLLGGQGVDQNVKNDGEGILKNVLGGQQSGIQQTIAQKVGLDAGTVAQILKIAAPIVLGFLGKKKQENNVNEPGGLSELLGGLLGSHSGGGGSIIESLLDRNGDGSVMDDVTGMLLGNKAKKGGSGSLGNLFGD